MRYFALFSDSGERIMTFVADSMPLTVVDILQKYPQAIEITEEEQALYMKGYIRGKNGKPQMASITANLADAIKEKCMQIQDMAKAELIKTDHNIVEYYELNNLTEEEYNKLKQQRQSVRNYRDNLIASVVKMTDVNSVNAVEFRM